MAREFSTSEIIRQKCSICGMNNKKYTELVHNGKYCGYKLTCCNCGHVDTFITDPDYIATHVYDKGREVCVHLTTCKNIQCPYYNKYPLWRAATKIEDILNLVDEEENATNNGCGIQNQNSRIENLDKYKLDINGYEVNKPKFH